MKKKGIIIAVVIVIIIVLVFVFSGKSKAAETGDVKSGSTGGSTDGTTKSASVASKWNLALGSWTLAEREAALSAITVRMGYLNPGGPWEKWGVRNATEAVEGPIYQVMLAWENGANFAFPVYKDWNKMLEELRANGVYQNAVELKPSIIKFSIPRANG